MKIRLLFFSFLLSFSVLISCKGKKIEEKLPNNFKEIIESKTTLYELYDFLKSTNVNYEENIEDYYHTIKFDSFSVVFDKYGMKIK